MVKKNNEHKIDTAENMFGGSGKVSFKRIIETPEGEYNDNGSIVTMRAGDTAFCPDGEGHCIANRGTEPLVFLALIVYK